MTEKEQPLEVWGYDKVAEVAGVKVPTLRRYKKTGHMPPPDITIRNSPGWYPATITDWVAKRPGKGFRSDLKDT